MAPGAVVFDNPISISPTLGKALVRLGDLSGTGVDETIDTPLDVASRVT